MGRLQIVATPIGNLKDITLRALDALREADLILAEDTRRTRTLLGHFEITGKDVWRCDQHAEAGVVEKVVERVRDGQCVVLVSDAGTPVVSDPGVALVAAVRAAGLTVEPVPGPSAVMTAISAAGQGDGRFRFVGFLARGGRERRETLALIADTPESVVFFEAPSRLVDTLRELSEIDPTRPVTVARELTKLHEEIVSGSLAELVEHTSLGEVRGEITVVLGPRGQTAKDALTEAELDELIDSELAKGRRPKDIAEQLALSSGHGKRDIYQRVLVRKKAD